VKTSALRAGSEDVSELRGRSQTVGGDVVRALAGSADNYGATDQGITTMIKGWFEK
jgi:hypothetical protein